MKKISQNKKYVYFCDLNAKNFFDKDTVIKNILKLIGI